MSSDRLYDDPELVRFYDLENRWGPDNDFCAGLAGRARSFLDLGCGTGRLAAELAEGRDVFGVDPAAEPDQPDEPGEDDQQTDAAALRREADLGGSATLVSITGIARSDIDFSFDADWGSPDYWAPYVYQFSQAFARERDTVNQELRLVSGPEGRLGGADGLRGALLGDVTESKRRGDGGNLSPGGGQPLETRPAHSRSKCPDC